MTTLLIQAESRSLIKVLTNVSFVCPFSRKHPDLLQIFNDICDRCLYCLDALPLGCWFAHVTRQSTAFKLSTTIFNCVSTSSTFNNGGKMSPESFIPPRSSFASTCVFVARNCKPWKAKLQESVASVQCHDSALFALSSCHVLQVSVSLFHRRSFLLQISFGTRPCDFYVRFPKQFSRNASLSMTKLF